jgi:hypothetical protein
VEIRRGSWWVLVTFEVKINGWADLTLRKQVSKYYARGNLAKYLKNLNGFEYAELDTLTMVHEILKGMGCL